MKRTNQILTALAIALMFAFTTHNTTAQRGMQQGKQAPCKAKAQSSCAAVIPDLTEEQETKIKELRVEHMDDMMDYRNKLNEKQAQLRTLETADDPDMDQINSTIDNMGTIRTEMHKERAAHKQEVRALLTKEHKLQFDRMHMNHRKGVCGRSGKAPGRRPGMQARGFAGDCPNRK